MMDYKDVDIKSKMEYLRAIPYLKKLKEKTIKKIALSMDTHILKNGRDVIGTDQIVDQTYIIKEGVIEVEVPFRNERLHFDYLPPGSSFCVFQAFRE